MSEKSKEKISDDIEEQQEEVFGEEAPNQALPGQELPNDSKEPDGQALKRNFASQSKYSLELKMNLAKLAAKYREEADNAERKVHYDERRKKWIRTKQEGFISKAVREYFDDLRLKPATDPLFRKAVELSARCLKNYDENEYDDNAPPIKKSRSTFRAKGGGRKTQAVDFREELFNWFMDI